MLDRIIDEVGHIGKSPFRRVAESPSRTGVTCEARAFPDCRKIRVHDFLVRRLARLLAAVRIELGRARKFWRGVLLNHMMTT